MNVFWVELFQDKLANQLFWSTWVFIVGCCLGSFLNVCIWRMPLGESVIIANSHCPNCNHQIKWYENIPLISFLCLKAKCSSCHKPITWRYFIVEFITGVFFVLAYISIIYKNVNHFQILAYGAIIMIAVVAAFIDYEHRIIPNKLTYTGMILGLCFTAFMYFFQDYTLNFVVYQIGGAIVIGGLLLALNLFGHFIFKQDALGLGDVKYLVSLALLSDPIIVLCTMIIASILGVIVGVIVAKINKKSIRRATIPFGPFLAVGSIISILLL